MQTANTGDEYADTVLRVAAYRVLYMSIIDQDDGVYVNQNGGTTSTSTRASMMAAASAASSNRSSYRQQQQLLLQPKNKQRRQRRQQRDPQELMETEIELVQRESAGDIQIANALEDEEVKRVRMLESTDTAEADGQNNVWYNAVQNAVQNIKQNSRITRRRSKWLRLLKVATPHMVRRVMKYHSPDLSPIQMSIIGTIAQSIGKRAVGKYLEEKAPSLYYILFADPAPQNSLEQMTKDFIQKIPLKGYNWLMIFFVG